MEALTLQSTEGTWNASVVALTVLRLLDRTQHRMLCAIQLCPATLPDDFPARMYPLRTIARFRTFCNQNVRLRFILSQYSISKSLLFGFFGGKTGIKIYDLDTRTRYF